MTAWPGLFITFEGGDGAGKSSLISKLAAHLTQQSRIHLCTREPGGTPLGDQIRQLLLDHPGNVHPRAELSLFLAARIQHIEQVILPALKEGRIVLCDRFHDSTIAYQGAGRELGTQWVAELCQQLCGPVMPQLTFFLDVDPKIGLERTRKLHRGKLDRIGDEQLEFHQRVRGAFLQIAQAEPERFHLVDASQSADRVFQQVFEELMRAL